MSSQRPRVVPLRGGLDLTSPMWAKSPGSCIAGSNFLAEAEGYRVVDGFERLDGRDRPSEAIYSVLDFDAGQAAIEAGDVVIGAVSGATGFALVDGVLSSGSWDGGDAIGYLVLGDVSGAFADNESLTVLGVPSAVADGTQVATGAQSVADDLNWRGLARSRRRALIASPPGSGPVRAVFGLNGDIWCIRDDISASAGILHRATAAGWTPLASYGWRINFTAGTGTPFEQGDVITDVTSSETATVQRVVIQSGSFVGSDVVGYFVTDDPTGAFTPLGGVTSSGGGSATLGASISANSLPPGGKYDVEIHNFYGSLIAERAYAANGVGRAFEFDGTVFCPIQTQPDDVLDRPTMAAQFQNHLFLGFVQGAVVYSGLGVPVDFRAIVGAGEITIGSGITNMVSGTNTVLTITGETHIAYMAGTSSADFDLKVVSAERGAYAWSGMQVSSAWYVDATGLRMMRSDNSYGGFALSAQAPLVQPMFAAKAKSGVVPVGSYRVKDRDQIRIIYSDRSGISVYLGRKQPEVMQFTYPFQPFVVKRAIKTSLYGDVTLCGGEDGFVYALDAGTSYDGEEIMAFLRTSRDPVNSHRYNKRFFSAFFETIGTDSLAISIAPQTGFSDLDSAGERQLTTNSAGGMWNEVNWNEFVWSGSDVSEAKCDINSFGRAISFAILVNVTEEEHPSFQAVTTNWSMRGVVK